jgi:hypothetical protein
MSLDLAHNTRLGYKQFSVKAAIPYVEINSFDLNENFKKWRD